MVLIWETFTLLFKQKFPGRDKRTQRSCDLILCDFLHCGHVEHMVYANSPTSIEGLKDGIREPIEGIEQPIFHSVMKNFIKRMQSCERIRDRHLADIVLH